MMIRISEKGNEYRNLTLFPIFNFLFYLFLQFSFSLYFLFTSGREELRVLHNCLLGVPRGWGYHEVRGTARKGVPRGRGYRESLNPIF